MKARHLIAYLMVWVAYFFLLFLTSCKTKTVTQEHIITDTSASKGLEQNWQERFISAFEQMARSQTKEHETSVNETIHVKDSTSTTVDKDGNPIKTESWHSLISSKDSKEVLRLQDSLSVKSEEVDKYHQLLIQKDSLIRLKQDSIKAMGHELTKADQRYITLGKMATGVVVFLVVLVIVLLIWPRLKKKG